MEYQTLFWGLICLAGLQALGLILIGYSIKIVLKSSLFRGRLLEKEKDDSPSKKIIGVLLLILLSSIWNQGYALSVVMEEVPNVVNDSLYNRTSINILLVINCVMAAGLLYARSIFKNFYALSVSPERLQKSRRKKRLKLKKIFTDAVPLSEEESILLNHDYDGITELDNNLPPWWKWGFYLTIVVGIFYMVNYHVLKTSPLQYEEYELSMIEADAEVAAYLEAQALNVDEKSVTILTEESDIIAGHSLFTQYCIVCHVEGGSGSVGPNLTDDYWIYGDDISNIFSTIKYGAENGMKSWKDELNPVQMQQVSSYIITLRGTNPPNPKEPQGDYYSSEKVENTFTDSTVVDSILTSLDTLQ